MSKTKIRSSLRSVLAEFFDGYALVGRVAGKTDIVIIAEIPDMPSKVGVLCGMTGLVEELNRKHGISR